MKTARLAVLGVALAAGLGAAYFMMGSRQPTQVVQVVTPPLPTDAVLVATHELNFGSVIVAEDIRWQPWPKDSVPAGTISRSSDPKGFENAVGSIIRSNFSAGEPLRADRLAKGSGSGFLSAVLTSGMRAVAIDLSDQGKSAAGGFILPNDRVDVIRTFHPLNASSNDFASETLLTNIRVLAIGQNVQEKAGERTVIGATATLEMTSDQAEKVILAQRTGQLTLALRSLSDASADDKPTEQPQSMTIIRSGNASESRVK